MKVSLNSLPLVNLQMHIYAWSAICWSTRKCNMLINACPLHIYLYLYRSLLIMKWFNKTRIDLSHIMYNWLCKFWMPFWYARGRNKLAFILIKVKTRPFFPNEKKNNNMWVIMKKIERAFPKTCEIFIIDLFQYVVWTLHHIILYTLHMISNTETN